MPGQERLREACASFAEVLDYPRANPARLARRCSRLLTDRRAASMMEAFASFCEGHSLERLQEVYTRTFDLCPSCPPYLGYHLFGDGYKRGELLARLKGRYRESGLTLGNELPDHLTLVLRFLALPEDGEEKEELIRFFLQPALDRMVARLLKDGNPYAGALQALSLTTSPRRRKADPAKAEVKAS